MHFILRSAFFFVMTCNEIIEHIEAWAPKGIAWDRDNVGLQVGSPKNKVKNILLCLDLTDEVIDDAIKKKCNLIISHHPLLFRPLKRLDFERDKNSKLVQKLIQNDISLYSFHTNLDFTKDGVSFQLAKKLRLKNINFLQNLKANQYKLSMFVPPANLNAVAGAIFNAGGGIIGEYSNCSFSSIGTGSFTGSAGSSPYLGEKGKFERVEEVKIEVVVNKWSFNKVMEAVREVHPYEEIAYHQIALENDNVNYGAGAVGELEKPVPVKEFLNFVANHLKIKNLRYTPGAKKRIKKVAVCGGSGGEFIVDAIKSSADAYVTADLKYHTFQDYQNKILLIDAGHYETEIPVMDEVKKRLIKFIPKDSGIKVSKHGGSTSPVYFFNK